MNKIFNVAIFGLLLLSFSNCSQNSSSNESVSSKPEHYFEGNTMGTTYHIKQCDSLFATKQEIDSLLLIIDSSLSTYNPDSYISYFNRDDISQVPDSAFQNSSFWAHFNQVFIKADRINRLSQGAFDPSAAAIFNAWGFGEKEIELRVNPSELNNLRKSIGMHHFLFPSNYVLKLGNSKATLNFNAIAKGYGVDKIAEHIEKSGCNNYMVEIGGEVACKGFNSNNEVWKIGINIPSENASPTDFSSIISLKDAAMATSGNYRNYYEENGERYGHTIDPRTAYPAKNKLLSATVIADNCADADAWATACMVLGVDSSLSILNNIDGIDAYLIYNENGVYKDTSTLNFGWSE